MQALAHCEETRRCERGPLALGWRERTTLGGSNRLCASEANEGGRGACRRRRRLATDNGRCAEAKEAQIEDKLAKERARDEAVSGIKHKQEARKAAKVGKKQQLKQTLKANLKEAGRGKNKARKSGKSKAEEAGGDAQEGEGAAHDKKRRRVSWGQDQEREFFS